MNKRSATFSVIILTVALAMAMAYFVRPHVPNAQLVTEYEELPDPNAHYSVASGLSERVSKSYGLALVLVISEFSRKNATALEALRSWAHDNFQKDPAFLHAVSTKDVAATHNSIIDSLCYNLFLPPRYLIESQILNGLKHQIGAFHETKYYQSFRADYYDSFGLDRESARMLAQYQSERAQQSVEVVLAALYWLVVSGIGFLWHLNRKPTVRSSRWQRSLTFFWAAMSLFYIVVSWIANDLSVLVSSMVCAIVAIAIRRPIAISFGEDKGLSFKLLTLSNGVLAIITWVSLTLVTIQFLTWIHTGTLANPDPITLLISVVSGDFLHDHSTAKGIVSRILGVTWIVSSIWALWMANTQQKVTEPVEPVEPDLVRQPMLSGR